MTVTAEPLRSFAFVNYGRWVADCAACPSALELQPGQAVFRCLDKLCGAESLVVWPDDVSAIEALLADRRPQNRNWHPGESPGDLLAENIEHGVTPVKGL